MRRIRMIVCDDEPAACTIVTGAFQAVFRQKSWEVECRTCGTAGELERAAVEFAPDLLILDIDLPGVSGIQIGRRLRQLGNEIGIIYVSNREDKVFDSLKVDPIGFVRKAHLLEDVPYVVENYLRQMERQGLAKKFVVENRDQVISVPLKSILYFEGARNCQMLHIAETRDAVPVHRKMQELEEELGPEGFLRIHKGYLVNYDYIRLIGETSVLLTNGENIPISRRKIQETKQQFLRLMRARGSAVQ